MSDNSLCPFSKPIIGQWCRCEHARLSQRCSGKMACNRAEDYRPGCIELVDILKQQARFVLALGKDQAPLTHTQSMKIRCGGLRGMQALLQASPEVPPSVIEVIELARQAYGELAAFPFHRILRDINDFSHRQSRRKA